MAANERFACERTARTGRKGPDQAAALDEALEPPPEPLEPDDDEPLEPDDDEPLEDEPLSLFLDSDAVDDEEDEVELASFFVDE